VLVKRQARSGPLPD